MGTDTAPLLMVLPLAGTLHLYRQSHYLKVGFIFITGYFIVV